MHTIAFYNIENLFDIYDDKFTNDNDFLPESDKKWTPKRYENKLRKLGFAMSQIGKEETGKPPVIIGLAEVENNLVLDDLISSQHLDDLHYDYVHFDSLDERGIDVALLYDKRYFEVIMSEIYPLNLYEADGTRDYTRDILYVTGNLEGERVHFLVNHWPSRNDGEVESEPKRMTASEKVVDIISLILTEEPLAKIVVMGDFNDDPTSNSIKNLVMAHDLYNTMETINLYKRGSLSHNFKWNVFDQILISTNFFETHGSTLSFVDANVFDADFLKQFHGPYKDTPFRTYVGKKYKGGYSDHFPTYMIVRKS